MSYSYLSTPERSIVHNLIKEGLNRGFKVSVNDGEEWVLKKSTNISKIKNVMGSTEEEILSFVKGEEKDRKRARFWLIYGNNCDVIADYTDNEDGNELWKAVEPVVDKWSMN